jgi:hypothetical protein
MSVNEIEMALGVWQVDDIGLQPEITLTNWRIFESDKGERHFVGYCLEDRSGRVSSAIEGFDPRTQRGVTRSGRVYQLKGQSGCNANADHTWSMFKIINEIETCKDVSEEVIRSIDEARAAETVDFVGRKIDG